MICIKGGDRWRKKADVYIVDISNTDALTPTVSGWRRPVEEQDYGDDTGL